MYRLALVLLAVSSLVLAACRAKAPQAERPRSVEPAAARPDPPAVAPQSTPAAAAPEPADPAPDDEQARDIDAPPPLPAVPVRLQIPRIGVNARVIPVGVAASGEMESPYDAWTVGWFSPGYKPMEAGNAVMAAHVDYINVGPAVFYNLRLLAPGDRIVVVGAEGQEFQFEVKGVQRLFANNAPVGQIFGPNPNRGLNLITCGGTFNPRTGEYDQRVVVYAEAIL